MPRKRKYLNTKYPEDFDNSRHEAEHITTGYADKNGIPYSLRFVLGSIIILLLFTGLWMIYKNQSSQDFILVAGSEVLTANQTVLMGMACLGFPCFWR